MHSPSCRRSLRFSGILVLAGCAAACATLLQAPQPSADAVLREDYRALREQVYPLIRRLQAEQDIKGISIAVVDGQTVVWSEGFGYADVAAQRPATPQTLYRIASISKLFTSTAVMQLAERGRIALDQPLAAYLPQFSIRSRFESTAPVTVRSMISHHSGLPSDITQGMWSDASFTTVVQRLPQEYLAYPPGSVLNYSNLGYSLLGNMIERVSGQDFEGYMQASVLGPLGMAHSGYTLKPVDRPLLAKAYRDGCESELLPMRDLPAMGMYSNVRDLASFMEVMLAGGGPVLRSDTVASVLQEQNSDVAMDMNIRVGLGWFLDRKTLPGAGLMAYHGGATPLFNAHLAMLPQHKLGVVVLSNTAGSRLAVGEIAEEVLRRAFEAKTDQPAGRPAPTTVAKSEVEPASAEFGARYATELGLLVLTPQKKVCACLAGKTYDLTTYPDGWFGVKDGRTGSGDDSGLRELRLATGKIKGKEVMLARSEDAQVRLLGEKVPAAPMSDAWRRRVGHFDVLNPDKGFPVEGFELRNEQGVLCLSYRMPVLSEALIHVPIYALSDTEAIVLGPGRTQGETIRVSVQDGEERLHYSGYEVRQRVN